MTDFRKMFMHRQTGRQKQMRAHTHTYEAEHGNRDSQAGTLVTQKQLHMTCSGSCLKKHTTTLRGRSRDYTTSGAIRKPDICFTAQLKRQKHLLVSVKKLLHLSLHDTGVRQRFVKR